MGQIRLINPIALRKAKIIFNFGLSECSRLNTRVLAHDLMKNAAYNLMNTVAATFLEQS